MLRSAGSMTSAATRQPIMNASREVEVEEGDPVLAACMVIFSLLRTSLITSFLEQICHVAAKAMATLCKDSASNNGMLTLSKREKQTLW